MPRLERHEQYSTFRSRNLVVTPGLTHQSTLFKMATKEQIALAEPLSASKVCVEAWYMDKSSDKPSAPHKQSPNVPASAETLKKLGVKTWNINADKYKTEPKLEAIRKVHNYTFEDIMSVSKDDVKTEYTEHIHDHDEVRFVLEGSGYYDVRDANDRWVRIAVSKGDMIVLPGGMYHRFTPDEKNSVKVMRFFAGTPVWTPINRSEKADARPIRAKYVQAIGV